VADDLFLASDEKLVKVVMTNCDSCLYVFYRMLHIVERNSELLFISSDAKCRDEVSGRLAPHSKTTEVELRCYNILTDIRFCD
jgi:hypothetical protein